MKDTKYFIKLCLPKIYNYINPISSNSGLRFYIFTDIDVKNKKENIFLEITNKTDIIYTYLAYIFI